MKGALGTAAHEEGSICSFAPSPSSISGASYL